MVSLKNIVISCVCVAFSFFSVPAEAQDKFFETATPVYKACLNSDASIMAFADSSNICFLDVSSFTLLGKIPYEPRRKGEVSGMWFHAAGRGISEEKLCVRFSLYGNYRRPGYTVEYPEDSLIIYNVSNGKKVVALPGNYYPGFGIEKDRYVVAYNRYLPLENAIGTISNFSRAGEIRFYPDGRTIELTGIVREIAISPDYRYLAIACFDSLPYGEPIFSLEIRDYQQFEIVARKEMIDGQITSMVFSDDGEFLSYVKKPSYGVGQVEILQIKDLKEPDPALIPDMKWFVFGQKRIQMIEENNAIIGTDLATGTQHAMITPNLTSLLSFEGAFLIGEDKAIVFGKDDNHGSWWTNGYSGGIEEIRLSDYALFNTIEEEKLSGIDTLFNSNEYHLQQNRFNDGDISLSASGNLLLSVAGDEVSKGYSLQVWNAPERRKLYSFFFSGEIQAFMDEKDAFILVLEDYHQPQYRDSYKIHLIDLNSGRSDYLIIVDPDIDDFDGNRTCNCYPVSQNAASWICHDGRNALWKLSKEQIRPERIFVVDPKHKAQGVVFKSVRRIPGLGSLVFSVEHKQDKYDYDGELIFDSIIAFDPVSRVSKKIDRIDPGKDFFFLSPDKVVVALKNSTKVLDLSGPQAKELIGMSHGGLRHVTTYGDIAYLIFEDTKSADSVEVIVLDLNRNQIIKSFKVSQHAGNDYFAANHGLIYRSNENITTYALSDGLSIKWISKYFSFFEKGMLSLDDAGNMLYNNSILINLFDLKRKVVIPDHKEAVLLKGELEGNLIYISLDAYGVEKEGFQWVISPVKDISQVIWKSEKIAYKHNLENDLKIILSPKGNFAAILLEKMLTYKDEAIWLVDLRNKSIKKIKTETSISYVLFSPDEKELFVSSYDGSSWESSKYTFFSTETGKPVRSVNEGFQAFSNSKNEFLNGGFNGLLLYELKNDSLRFKKQYFSKESIGRAKHLTSFDMYVGGTSNGMVYFWQVGSKSPVKAIRSGETEILEFIESGDHLFVFHRDGNVNIINLKTLNTVATLQVEKKENKFSFFWTTPEGYFSASKEDIRDFHFVKGLTTLPLIAVEVFFNRPDKIMSALGYASEEQINLFAEAYHKRLKRLNLKDKQDFFSRKSPVIELINKGDIPPTTQADSILFKLRIDPNGQKLERLHASVNGVPVFGVHGMTLKENLQKELDLWIRLNEGGNRVSFTVSDLSGIESLPVSADIVCNKTLQERIYYVGIGVSSYQDSSMNLHFAHSDVQNLERMFNREYSGRITSRVLVNEQVTRDNLLELKKPLLGTHENDLVVISFSGHGLLDKNLDFYFATYDMDFKNPEKRGFSYDQIQWLFDSIPARRKLLLMDACHSGEIDKETGGSETQSKADSNLLAYSPKGADAIVDESKIGLQNSFTLMQSLFNDFNRGNGAFIISAAAGKEYAYETDEIEGGVFTKSFIGAFYKLRDNRKKEVKILDLQNLVNQMVSERTQGKQTPTTRSDNLEWNWGFE